MISFKVERSVVDALDAIAERLAAEGHSGRPNRTAALRYLVDLDEKNSEKKQKITCKD